MGCIQIIYLKKPIFLKKAQNNKKRLADDPLRILRAYRFCYELNFLISKKLERAIKKNLELIKQLNPAKIREEIEKCPIEKRKNLINDLNLDFVYNSKI